MDRGHGLFLEGLNPGSIIDLETKSRKYRLEYVNGDVVRVSGHASICPDPREMHLRGSMRGLEELEPGYIAPGMRLVLDKPEEGLSVTTSEVISIRVNRN
jgi:hypothetical protein